MAKRGRAPQVRVVTPVGPITAFEGGLPPVEFRLNWEVPFHNPDGDEIATGWAIAYTADAGLVIWLTNGQVYSGWFPAEHIRRR